MTRFLAILTILLPAISMAQAASIEDIEEEVANVERAFAQTMADRDFQAFSAFIDDQAVFWSGSSPLRGKAAVLAVWKPYFEGPDAPFSWKPETVMALATGDLARSTGPVSGPDGSVGAYFTSTWRKNADGDWKVIFDKGQRYCPPDTE